MFKHWKMLLASGAALAMGLYLAIYGFGLPEKLPDPESIDGFFWPQQKALTEFEMINHSGNPFDLQSLDGQWTLIFFGYTYCPDICPVTMSQLREVEQNYQSLREQTPDKLGGLNIVFVSVDGERDNTGHLAAYIRFYSDHWMAASGNKSQVDSLTGQLGVPYEVDPHEPGSLNYLVAHTGALFLISPQATLSAVLQPPYQPQQIVDTITSIQRFMQAQ